MTMEMPVDTHAPLGAALNAPTKKTLWTGRVLSALPVLFLLMDGIGKLVQPEAVIRGTADLGFPASTILSMGIALLVCTVLYAIPRTAVLGAVLLTGYLGGAVATHVRVLNPLFSHMLFPIYVAAFLWGGLLLREPRLRALFPLRRD